MNETFYKNLGQKLKAYRKAKGITLKELADMLHKSIATLSKYESGDVVISIDALIDICKALNIDITECLPSTYKDEHDVNILKYEKYFIDKLYIYWYNKELGRVKTGIIENSNLSMKSMLYLSTDASHDEYQSDYTYHGQVSYSDTSITFNYTNEAPPFDKVFIRMPLLFPKDHPMMGIMSCISYYYQGVTAKILISRKPLSVDEEIKNQLLINADEIKELKRTNFLIIK